MAKELKTNKITVRGLTSSFAKLLREVLLSVKAQDIGLNKCKNLAFLSMTCELLGMKELATSLATEAVKLWPTAASEALKLVKMLLKSDYIKYKIDSLNERILRMMSRTRITEEKIKKLIKRELLRDIRLDANLRVADLYVASSLLEIALARIGLRELLAKVAGVSALVAYDIYRLYNSFCDELSALLPIPLFPIDFYLRMDMDIDKAIIENLIEATDKLYLAIYLMCRGLVSYSLGDRRYGDKYVDELYSLLKSKKLKHTDKSVILAYMATFFAESNTHEKAVKTAYEAIKLAETTRWRSEDGKLETLCLAAYALALSGEQVNQIVKKLLETSMLKDTNIASRCLVTSLDIARGALFALVASALGNIEKARDLVRHLCPESLYALVKLGYPPFKEVGMLMLSYMDSVALGERFSILLTLRASSDIREGVVIDLSEVSRFLRLDKDEIRFPPLKAGQEITAHIQAEPLFTGRFSIPITIVGPGNVITREEIRLNVTKISLPPVISKPALKPVIKDMGVPVGKLTDYELLELIGYGGFGIVYKAREKSSGRLVAVKIPRDRFVFVEVKEGSVKELIEQFEHEISIWRMLTERGVVGVVQLMAFGTEPYPWLAMKFMPNGSLRDRIGRLDWREAMELIIELASIIHEIHLLGIRHLDIKPENILFDEEERPHISDFGMAQLQLFVTKTTGRPFFGTPAYAAPEQISSKFGRPDHRTDIYQLGAVLYELLTGRPPFVSQDLLELAYKIGYEEPPPPHRLSPEVPESVSQAVLRALAKRPEERYEDALEFKRILRGCLS